MLKIPKQIIASLPLSLSLSPNEVLKRDLIGFQSEFQCRIYSSDRYRPVAWQLLLK